MPDKSALQADLLHHSYTSSDVYKGSADAIIAAGLATYEQLPLLGNKNRSRTTWYDGVQITRGKGGSDRGIDRSDERYVQIFLVQGLYVVHINVSEKEAVRRARGWSAGFARFMDRVYTPGPIKDSSGTPLDVQALDDVRGLGGLDRIENDWLSELELWPLPSDNVPELSDRASYAWNAKYGRRSK